MGKPDNWVPVQEGLAFQPPKLKVVYIGVGYAGLMLSYQYKHGDTPLEQFMDLKIYERNDDIGGTWLVTNFLELHATFLHISTHSPLSRIPPGANSTPQVQRYGDTSRAPRIILSSIWDDNTGKWRLEIRQGHSRDIVHEEADIVINATGFLSKWTLPTIAGLENSKGKLIHTAAWDTSLDWSDKRVAIIGNGSSVVQLLSQMQPTAAKIVNYARSPLWISSAFVSEFAPEGKNFTYTDQEIQAFKDDEGMFFQLRHSIEHSMNKFFRVSVKDSPE
ncbi:monooxygenase [Fusarium phyllophilum]|uniref:Monooxygenase n=1 Tax=Fusarium phyllophilum TaxID=47803 RepID=A0A8H5NHM7_9HYPO|nr:monooxygenase [Fusarium phyllophilum]